MILIQVYYKTINIFFKLISFLVKYSNINKPNNLEIIN